MELPDLTHLTLVQVITTFLLFAALDTGVGIVVAVINKNYEPAYTLDFLRTHILKVGTPILGLALVGHGIPGFVPAIPAAGAAATLSLGGYVLVTIMSLKDTFDDQAVAPTTTSNVSPVVTPPAVQDPTPPTG